MSWLTHCVAFTWIELDRGWTLESPADDLIDSEFM